MNREQIRNRFFGEYENSLFSYLNKEKIIKLTGKNREEKLERWAKFVKANPEWKKHHTSFINAQYDKFLRFIDELSKTKDGQRKLVEIYNIQNIKGYPDLLNKLQSADGRI